MEVKTKYVKKCSIMLIAVFFGFFITIEIQQGSRRKSVATITMPVTEEYYNSVSVGSRLNRLHGVDVDDRNTIVRVTRKSER